MPVEELVMGTKRALEVAMGLGVQRGAVKKRERL